MSTRVLQARSRARHSLLRSGGARQAVRFVGASLAVGLEFGVLHGVLNDNPLARRAYAVFDPIAASELNVAAGVAIDLGYGFELTAIFLKLQPALPGDSPVRKGFTFGALVWFLRVLMNTAGQWMMFAIPGLTVLYGLAAGLVEMLIVGALIGVLHKSAARPAAVPPGGPADAV